MKKIKHKYTLLYIFLFLGLGVWASEPIKIGVISDTHYLSEKFMEKGTALDNYVSSSGKNVKDVPAILDKVLNEYLSSDIEVLLVCGDITKDGERQSHIDFKDKIKPLQDKGIKVYVIPGNHDINMPNSVEFKGNKSLPVPTISSDEFLKIYADCGYNDAIKRDKESLSYVARLNEDTWLLAIDAARYQEYTARSISAGRIKPETEKWISGVLADAKNKGIQVIGMMHWGLTEHIMFQSMFFKDYLVEDWERLANLFADNGMKAIFTGHFHSNDITAFTSDRSNVIYDIETGTLSSYPFSYRFIELNKKGMDAKTKNIIVIPNNPNLAEEDKSRMKILSEKRAIQKLKSMGYDLPNAVLSQFASVLGEVFILHAYGDEKVDYSLRLAIKALADDMDTLADIDDIELDFPPADNNVEIVF